jgi:uncharacterized membrane protein
MIGAIANVVMVTAIAVIIAWITECIRVAIERRRGERYADRKN